MGQTQAWVEASAAVMVGGTEEDTAVWAGPRTDRLVVMAHRHPVIGDIRTKSRKSKARRHGRPSSSSSFT